MKKFLVFVIALVVLSAGCLESEGATYTFQLPHAKNVIIAQQVELQATNPVLKKVVVDFETFQQLATGTVYVTMRVPSVAIDTIVINFYTLVNGTVFIGKEEVVLPGIFPDAESYHLVVNGTTVILTKGG